jgi:hypothetical protein
MSAIQTHRFNWLPQKSAWQDMRDRRAKRAEAIQKDLANMDAVNTSMSNALQNHITGSATNAAQTALTRIQNNAKSASSNITKQIDAAQRVIDQTQTQTASATTTDSTTSTSTVVDSLA